MTLYAPMSVPAVKLEVGGCGKTHTRKKGERLSVSCVPCENVIKQYFVGWGTTPAGATLTEEEQSQLEQDAADRDAMFRVAGRELGENIAKSVAAKKR